MSLTVIISKRLWIKSIAVCAVVFPQTAALWQADAHYVTVRCECVGVGVDVGVCMRP